MGLVGFIFRFDLHWYGSDTYLNYFVAFLENEGISIV